MSELCEFYPAVQLLLIVCVPTYCIHVRIHVNSFVLLLSAPVNVFFVVVSLKNTFTRSPANKTGNVRVT